MLTLRAAVEADLPTFYAQQTDVGALAMAGFQQRDEPAFFAHWRQKVLSNPNGTALAIVTERHEVAGYVLRWSSEGLDLVGYWVGREHWGRGIASEALKQFLGLEKRRPLDAFVIPSNVRSMRVLEKNGFVRGPQRVEDGVLEVQFTLR